MKYLVCVGDGMADLPVEALGGKTPLQAVRPPMMDALAAEGQVGTVRTVPPGMEPGTDVAMISVFGYDPQVHYKGRGPWEAASMGIPLEDRDVAFRCNTVTLRQGTMTDYSAGHIPTEESRVLIKLLNDKLGDKQISFYPGVGYRHLLVWRGGSDQVKTTPPHNMTGQPVEPYWPSGRGERQLKKLMEDASFLLAGHEINRNRRGEGKAPANGIWLWGAGKRPTLPTYQSRFQLEGGVISAVDIVFGMGILAGLDMVRVPGATGYYDTNYAGKAEAAVKVLKKKDFCLVHVEAPDEASHNGHVEEKTKSIHRLDQEIVKPLAEWLKNSGHAYRVLVLPDHITEVVGRKHNAKPIPYVMAGQGILAGAVQQYDEIAALQGTQHFQNGVELIETFIKSDQIPPVTC